MSMNKVTRRGFLTQGSAAAVGAAALIARRAHGANERIGIGIIGAGGRGTHLMGQIRGQAAEQNVQITAVCDVWAPNRQRAANAVKQWVGREPHQVSRFQELLALSDVDAVVIATPDFAHTPILIAALKAGKDAYVEKPMSIDVDNANKALDLARERKRVVQVGTQYRSDGSYRAIAKVLAVGQLGQVSRITAEANFNQARWNRDVSDCKEKDVDWKAYLLGLRRRPFDASLLRRWHFYRECTNGLAGLWMSHYVDAVHLMTGAKYPRSVVAHGNVYVWKDGRQHCDTFHALLDYPEGFLLSWSMGLANSAGTHFTVYGTKGSIEIGDAHMTPNRLMLSADGGESGSNIKTRKIQADPPAGGDPIQSHMANWLECLRSRERPNADIQYGHQHAIATIMAAEALHTGRRQRYDHKRRKVRPG